MDEVDVDEDEVGPDRGGGGVGEAFASSAPFVGVPSRREVGVVDVVVVVVPASVGVTSRVEVEVVDVVGVPAPVGVTSAWSWSCVTSGTVGVVVDVVVVLVPVGSVSSGAADGGASFFRADVS